MLIAPIAVYIIGGVIFIEWHPAGAIGGLSAFLTWPGMVLGLAIGLIGGQAFWIVVALRPARPLKALLKRLRILLSINALRENIPIFLLLGPFSLVFGEIKSLIPYVNPFTWDATFASIDSSLHGGQHPWMWLEGPLLNGPAVTIISLLYAYAWHAILFAVLAHACFAEKLAHLRLRFLLAFFGSWIILGNVAATIFSSAGPAFYHHLFEPAGLYSPLLIELKALDDAGWLTPIPITELLWRVYQEPATAPPGLGISAMPSLHVGVACLYFLYARHHGRLLTWLAGFYFAVTMLGSVVLGWHYAIDGYAGILGAIAIWMGAGHITALDPSLGTSG